MKACSRCKETKPEEAYSFKKNGFPGLKSACKQCHAADTLARYRANPGPVLEYAKRTRQDPQVRRRINDRRNILRKQNPALELWRLARSRARRRGIPFDIEIEDVQVPSHCPVLGLELNWGCAKRQIDASPTVDRVRPELGYVKGNVRVISWRANRFKSDAKPEETFAVARYVAESVGISTHAWAALGVAVFVDWQRRKGDQA